LSGWYYKDVINDSEDEDEDEVMHDKPQLIDSNGGTYKVQPTYEAESRRHIEAIRIREPRAEAHPRIHYKDMWSDHMSRITRCGGGRTTYPGPRDVAGISSLDKQNVDLTLDAIAEVLKGEVDFTTVLPP
jgi:hypothetical protein